MKQEEMRITMWSIPAVVGPPVTGDGNELQEELDTRQFVKDLRWFPVQSQRAVLDQKLHHFHHLLTAVADRLEDENESTSDHDRNTNVCLQHKQSNKA